MLKDLLSYLPNIHKEGFLFIAIFLVITVMLFAFSKTLGIIGVMLTVWCICFFRDPERVVPLIDNVVVSPADGIVDNIVQAQAPAELEMGEAKWTRVSIFLSVFDVHVNRMPASGVVEKLHYHPGKFVSATLDKASELNERQSVLMRTPAGHKLAVVQIAGLIARRIVCSLDEKQEVLAGQRYGIIRFGSRVDVYLPSGVIPKVYKGQKMVGGETVIAVLEGHQAAEISGEVR
jgi:phosphatidylserine decarboxylase